MSEDIINARKLMMKCASIADSVADQYIEIAVKEGLLIVQDAAKMLAPTAPISGGELKERIFKRTINTGSGVRGEVYTNVEYAPYVEFGTGPVGEANHKGISPKVRPVYVKHGWGIPSDKIDPKVAKTYKWPIRTYEGKDYYMTMGQAAQPFMYPALKSTENIVAKEIKRYLVRRIKEEANK